MRKQNNILQAVLIVGLSILCLLILFPFWLMLSASFTDGNALAANGYQIWPDPFTLEAYIFTKQKR